MRFMVLGAGAIGGYYGGRLLEAGADVTFLVRERRASQLVEHGLVVKSALGDIARPVKTLLAEQAREHFDVVLLSCKSYDLDGAIEAIRPALGSRSAVLPLLNGITHLTALTERLGEAHVIGGACYIGVTLDPAGAILHMGEMDRITFGELSKERSQRCEAIAAAFSATKVTAVISDDILQAMWEFVMLASLAASTTLTRANVGEIIAARSGEWLMLSLLGEVERIAAAEGHAPLPDALERTRKMLTAKGSTFSASMMRDMIAGNRTEADHIVGDLVRRAEKHAIAVPLLRTALANLEVHEARRRAGQALPASN
ncbi:MAG: ketopantoate reductase family protein [Hyphomicrobiales bacterium]|nr:ketopantoate reductase family protein [Hyphomicrobiales bacterium]